MSQKLYSKLFVAFALALFATFFVFSCSSDSVDEYIDEEIDKEIDKKFGDIEPLPPQDTALSEIEKRILEMEKELEKARDKISDLEKTVDDVTQGEKTVEIRKEIEKVVEKIVEVEKVVEIKVVEIEKVVEVEKGVSNEKDLQKIAELEEELQKINDRIGKIDIEVEKIVVIEGEISKIVSIQEAINQIAGKMDEIVTKVEEIGDPQKIADILAKVDDLGKEIDKINEANDINDVREQVTGILLAIRTLNEEVEKIAALETEIAEVAKTAEGIQKTLADYKLLIDANTTGRTTLGAAQATLSGKITTIESDILGLAKLKDISDIETALVDIRSQINTINGQVSRIDGLEAEIAEVAKTAADIEINVNANLEAAQTALSGRIDVIEGKIEDFAKVDDVSKIESDLEDLVNYIATIKSDVAKIAKLEADIATINTNASEVEASIQKILADLKTKADATALATAEAKLLGLISDIESDIAKLAALEDIIAIEDEIIEIRKRIAKLEETAGDVYEELSPPELKISFVYLSNDAESPVTNSVVEIYNPNEDAVRLNTRYALHYKSVNGEWLKLNLRGTIPAKRSFLVNLGTAGSPVSFTQTNYKVGRLDLTGKFDQNFEAAYGKVTLDGAVAIKVNEATLDLVGISADEDDCEESCLSSSKNKGFARKRTTDEYTDSDNNSSDFVAVDFSTLDLTKSVCFPRGSKDEAWPGALTAASACPAASESYETIGLQPGSDATGVNFNWYSGNATANNASWVRIISADGKTIKASGTNGAAPTSTASKFYHRVGVTGLQQGTEYKYQISNDGANWYEVYNYKTTPTGSFTFAAISDVQLGGIAADAAMWKTVATKLEQAGVNFIVHTGDQVDATSTLNSEYTAFFAPPELRRIPFAPLMGNHDSHCEFIYRYNLPNEDKWPTTCSGSGMDISQTNDGKFDAGNYYYRYNNVLFIGLNTAYYPTAYGASTPNKANAQPFVNNFDKVIKAAKAANEGKYDFVVVFHHKSSQTIASHSADADIQSYVQAGLEKIMTENNVSLVLSGHDHINVRSKFLVWRDDLQMSVPNEINSHPEGIACASSVTNKALCGPFQGDNTGTVYLTLSTASGMKYYAPFTTSVGSTTFPNLADGTTGNAQLKTATATNKAKWLIGMEKYHDSNAAKSPEYTIVNVSGGVMSLITYRNDTGAIIDEFQITTANIPRSTN